MAYLLPPSRKQLDKINTLIANWIKNKSKLLPKYSTFQLDYNREGLDASVLKDMLDARLTSIWIKLLSADSLWARIERTFVSESLQAKRNTNPLTALTRTSIKLKGWPDYWKLYLTAWKRLKGTIIGNNNWPWNISQFNICKTLGEQFTVQKATEFLKQESIKPTAFQVLPNPQKIQAKLLASSSAEGC